MFIEFTESYAVEASRICGISKPRGYDDTIAAFLEMGSHANPIQRTLFTYESEGDRDRVYDAVLTALGAHQSYLYVKPLDLIEEMGVKEVSPREEDPSDKLIDLTPDYSKLASDMDRVEVDTKDTGSQLTIFFSDGTGPFSRFYTIIARDRMHDFISEIEDAGVPVYFNWKVYFVRPDP